MISAQAFSHPVFKLPFLRCCHEYAKSVYSSNIIGASLSEPHLVETMISLSVRPFGPAWPPVNALHAANIRPAA